MTDNNDNVEEKLKDIIKNKLHSGNNLDDNTMDLINKLYEIFPNLKNEQGDKTNQTNKYTTDNNEIVLDEFVYNDIVYYKDKHGGVWDNKAELVGIVYKGQVYLFE